MTHTWMLHINVIYIHASLSYTRIQDPKAVNG